MKNSFWFRWKTPTQFVYKDENFSLSDEDNKELRHLVRAVIVDFLKSRLKKSNESEIQVGAKRCSGSN